MPKLADISYLAFPFRVGPSGPRTDARAAHVRGQIEQVLFTNPGERVFRPEFGAGLKQLVFEPNTSALTEVLRKRLSAALTDVLRGEVDPKTLAIDVRNDNERLEITVSYRLATINRDETYSFSLGAEGMYG